MHSAEHDKITATGRNGGAVPADGRWTDAGESAYGPMFAAFLEEHEVEREFLEARDLHHRARLAEARAQDLAAEARSTKNVVEAQRRRSDPERRKRLTDRTGVLIAALLAILDVVPAYLAAQTFGFDLLTTIGITALFVAAMGAIMWALHHNEDGWQRWSLLAGLGVGLVVLGALRWQYLVVTAGPDLSGLLQAAALTVFTGVLIWLGVFVLGLTNSRELSDAMRRSRRLDRLAADAAVSADRVGQQDAAATRELSGRAIVSYRRHRAGVLDDTDQAPKGFAEYVRAQIAL
jgi:hypothetical protein